MRTKPVKWITSAVTIMSRLPTKVWRMCHSAPLTFRSLRLCFQIKPNDMNSVKSPPAAAASIGPVGRSIGSERRMAPITSTSKAMASRKPPLTNAPMISARYQPKLWSSSAGRWASRAATIATRTPPTAEKVWKASEITAMEPVQRPIPISTKK